MVEIHPKILEKNGKKEFVVLSYEEYIEIQNALSDYEDLQALRNAKNEEGDAPTQSLEEVKRSLDL